MKILTSVKIKNYLDDLVNAKTMSLDDFHFTIGKMGYEVDKAYSTNLYAQSRSDCQS